jgi:hypothetical protein
MDVLLEVQDLPSYLNESTLTAPYKGNGLWMVPQMGT